MFSSVCAIIIHVLDLNLNFTDQYFDNMVFVFSRTREALTDHEVMILS